MVLIGTSVHDASARDCDRLATPITGFPGNRHEEYDFWRRLPILALRYRF